MLKIIVDFKNQLCYIIDYVKYIIITINYKSVTLMKSYAVSTEHPEYTKRKSLWEKIDDCIAGEEQIKQKREKYLPRPSGMDNTKEGQLAYESYITRAHFPAFTEKLLSALTGITKINPPKIELPKGLDYLREDCDGDDTPLDIYFFQSVRQALKTGRQLLLPDIDQYNNRINLVRYYAEDVINWGVVNRVFNNKDCDFFVIKEYVHDSDDIFVHEYKEQYRVLTTADMLDKDSGNYFASILFDESQQIIEDEIRIPSLMGKSFEGLPVSIIGSTDLLVNPDSIPLLGVASCALQMYMKDADLSNAMFLTCNPTLCISGYINKQGETFHTLVGSNVAITLEDPQGKVYYPTTDSSALQEVRNAISMYMQEAQSMGSTLLNANTKNVESEGALKIKSASTTASLSSVTQTVARGFEKVIRDIAVWMGLDDQKVNIKVDNNYLDNILNNEDINTLMSLMMNDVISHETVLDKLKEGNYLLEGFDSNKEIEKINEKKNDNFNQFSIRNNNNDLLGE